MSDQSSRAASQPKKEKKTGSKVGANTKPPVNPNPVAPSPRKP